jgi:hypothetical protein
MDAPASTSTFDKQSYGESTMWVDPLADQPPGILLSDKIAYYAKACKLIVPFDTDALAAASYTLHVGDKYWIGREPTELKAGECVTIRPNDLVYIRVLEYFNIPHYMVGRYSLRVKTVYRGLILDNGLQIDPGFCPGSPGNGLPRVFLS